MTTEARTDAAAERVADARTWLHEFLAEGDDGTGSVRLALARAGEWSELGPFRANLAPFAGKVADHAGMLDVLAEHLVAHADEGHDVYAAAYMHRWRRRKGGAIARRHVHADVDGPLDVGRVRQLGGMAVASGSLTDEAPHGHVYLRLSEDVEPRVHEVLCRALSHRVGGEYADLSKVSDVDVLRPPGTLNHKTEPPRPVTWLIRPDDDGVRTWEPATLARLLGTGWPIPEPAEHEPAVSRPTVRAGATAARLDGLVRSVTDAPPGEGNNRLNWAAWKAGALCAADPECGAAETVQAELVAAFLARPLPAGESAHSREREALATVRSGWQAGTADPGKALADDRTTESPRVVLMVNEDDGEPRGEAEDDDEAGERARVEVAPGVRVDAEAEARFWTSGDALARVRQYAQARRASPWSTLGVVLARVMAATDHRTVLPPLVGGDGSLNLFVALVGATSAGKGAAGNAGRDVLRLCTAQGDGDTFDTVQPGSGEGIAHVFAHREKRRGAPSRVVRHAWSVLLDAREAESMAAILQRNGGGTLAAELCKAWMGEHLGHATADPSRYVPVEAHAYRLAFLMGVQPALAGWLTALTAGGLPGRFLWLPTLDAQRPARGQRPEAPAPLRWDVPNSRPRVLDVPDEVVDAVEAHADAQAAGVVPDLDGHRVFLREKVAAALTLLDEPDADAVAPLSWELAGHVVAVSDATRTWLLDTLAAERRSANVARGRAEGERAAVAAETVASATEARVARRVLEIVREAGDEGMARGAVRGRLRSADRGVFDAVLPNLTRTGLVASDERQGQGRMTEWLTAL